MRPNINKPAVCCCCFRSTLVTRNNKNKQTPVKVVGIGRLLGAVGAEFKTETVHKHQPASHSYGTNRAVGSSVRLRGVSTVVYSSPVPSLSVCVCLFCCLQVGEVWREGGGGRREVEQAARVHAVPAQSFWAEDVSPDGNGAAGPGGLLSASDSRWD